MRKFIWIVGFVLAFAIPTLAQQASPTPAEYSLKINNDDVNTIGKALGKLPFDEVAGLIQKLREQIISQNQAAVKPPAKE